ncbi:activating transcription factor 7-interacting protein 2-like isoform X2 [Trichogramma pretiosum]|uniref:activating transcription factor 7-interacting protein 2-like isoform X2 n=1 Tax=Trichogramma pretiosum TaxID=7493 RepID=UPI0006C984CA|nr:activating transcription factor 7-interacting protein 2-like isoform X2 [Trichogramma pretiosum]
MNDLNGIYSQVKRMSIEDLENFCIQAISECISAHNEIQELHSLTLATKKAQRNLRSKCKMLESQCQQFERILDGVDNDGDDEVMIYAEPMKLKRCVGIQIDMPFQNIDYSEFNNNEEQATEEQNMQTMSSETAVPEEQIMQTMSSDTTVPEEQIMQTTSSDIIAPQKQTMQTLSSDTVDKHSAPKATASNSIKYSSTAPVSKIGKLEEIPPSPILKITQDVESIALAWNLDLSPSIAKIAYYELFVYHEKDPKYKDWKKIGHFEALPLPMGCTLSQMGKGTTYYFAVRAVDVHSRSGPFSRAVSTIICTKSNKCS